MGAVAGTRLQPIDNLTFTLDAASLNIMRGSDERVIVADMHREDGGDPTLIVYTDTGISNTITVRAQEEQTSDTEVTHANEPVDFISFPQGYIKDKDGVIIGECGIFTANCANSTDVTTVSLNKTDYSNLVVIMVSTLTTGVGGVYASRVASKNSSSFSINMVETPNLDGAHGDETFHYIVFEKGRYTIGRQQGLFELEAGIGTGSAAGSVINFTKAFEQEPAIFSKLMSTNTANAVFTRNDLANTTSFTSILDAGQGDTAASDEDVGYVAVTVGGHPWETRGSDALRKFYQPAGLYVFVSPDQVTQNDRTYTIWNRYDWYDSKANFDTDVQYQSNALSFSNTSIIFSTESEHALITANSANIFGSGAVNKCVNCWVKPTGSADARIVYGHQNVANQRFYLGITGGVWDLGWGDSSWGNAVTGTRPTPVDNEWVNILINIVDGVASVYFDGSFGFSKTDTSVSLTGPFPIGAYYGTAGYDNNSATQGTEEIGLFQVYNTAISSDQITDLFEAYRHRFGV
jgi:hypothetical protein